MHCYPAFTPASLVVLARVTDTGSFRACGMWFHGVPVTIKEQDQAQSKDEALVTHRQLRLLVAELEQLNPTMPCLRLPCTACSRRWQQWRKTYTYRARMRSNVVMVESSSKTRDTASADANEAVVPDTEAGADTEVARLTNPDPKVSVRWGSLSQSTASTRKSKSRATSYWLEPWSKPAHMSVEQLASTLDRLADMHTAVGGQLEGTKTVVHCCQYTVAVKLAKAGAPSHWAKQIAKIFGTRQRMQAVAGKAVAMQSSLQQPEVDRFLSGLGQIYADYWPLLRENGWGVQEMDVCSEADLQAMGIKPGHAKLVVVRWKKYRDG